MKTILSILTFILCMGMVTSGVAGMIADSIGLYLPNEKGECKAIAPKSEKQIPDLLIKGVCVPLIIILDDKKMDVLYLAIIELTNPDELELVLQSVKYNNLFSMTGTDDIFCRF